MKRIVKRMICYILAISCVIGMNVIAPESTQAATKAALKSKLQATTSVPIRKFICEDLNGDGKKEAIAVTSEGVDEYAYINAKIWYITDKTCNANIYNSYYDLYKDRINLFSVKNGYIFTFEIGLANGGGANYFYGYSFDQKGPRNIENVGMGLDYLGNNKFVVWDSQYDAFTDGYGHTWNRYYSKWDGEKLVEYGGLKISQTQLKNAKYGEDILKQIKKKGKIGNIYYRANGLIFVNYTEGNQNYNVALKLKNGKVSYYDQGGSGKTKMENATQCGVIYKSITSCVKYPKSFPVK